jgi:hypothetical protein
MLQLWRSWTVRRRLRGPVVEATATTRRRRCSAAARSVKPWCVPLLASLPRDYDPDEPPSETSSTEDPLSLLCTLTPLRRLSRHFRNNGVGRLRLATIGFTRNVY